jgi:hypothetical protein
MNKNRKTPKLLGLMFLVVIAIGILSGLPLMSLNYSLTGPPVDVFATMTSFSENPSMVQLSIIGFLLESVAIVFLATLLYTNLKKQNTNLALWAFGLWIIEAVFLVMREVSAFCLLHVSQQFAGAGSQASSSFQTLGTLFYELMHFSYDVQMIFYTAGGFLFYYLFFKSKYIPKMLSLFGMVAATLGFFGEVYAIFGHVVPLYVYLPILPFELAIGFWLVFKGFKRTAINSKASE